MLTFESEHEPKTLAEPEPQTPTQTLQNPINNKEFNVYSRRKKNQDEIVPQTQLEQSHEVPFVSENKSDDLELPIVIKKGVRSCTKHSIYNFLSYNGLSARFRAFTISLTEIQIPNNIQETL